MKSLTPAERQSTLSAFVDVDAPALPVVDRSTLENYSVCPAMARFVEAGRVPNATYEMNSGNEAHAAISHAVQAYIDSKGGLTPGEVVNELEVWLRGARPDVQPDVIRAVRASVYAFGKFLAGMHPDNILRFDGGEGDRTGQLARDLSGIRVTSELDLLHSGPAKQLLHEIDYKTGHKLHSSQSVRDSFQFQLHWWLVAEAYPDVEALAVTVWNTRQNRRTWAVEFTRADLPAIDSRIRSAVAHYSRWRLVAPEQAEAWPEVEKCSSCRAAHVCPVYANQMPLAEQDAEATVDWLVAAEAQCDAVRKQLAKVRDNRGADIETKAGNIFGRDKPSSRKATATIYKRAKESEPEGNDDAGADS